MDNDGNGVHCPLGLDMMSGDRRCGSSSPTTLRHAKQESIKTSSTDPQLSSMDVGQSQDRNVRCVVHVCWFAE